MHQDNVNIDQVVKDRIRSESDNSGIHQGWYNMASLLDGQDNSKRKPLAWWKWSLPLVALIATGSIIWGISYNYNNEEKQTPTHLTNIDNSNSSLANAVYENSAHSVVDNTTNTNKLIASSNHTSDNNNALPNANGPRILPKKNSLPLPARVVGARVATINKSIEDGSLQSLSLDNNGKLITNNSVGIKKNATIKDKNAIASSEEKNKIAEAKQHIKDIADKGLLMSDAQNNVVKKDIKIVNEISVIERPTSNYTNTPTYKDDTIKVSKAERIQYLPLSKYEQMAMQDFAIYRAQPIGKEEYNQLFLQDQITQSNNNKYQSSLTSIAEHNEVSKSTSGILSTNTLNINEFIELSKNWSGSVLLGGNMNMPYSPIGASAGFSLRYKFNDMWSLGTGINYLLRRVDKQLEDKETSYQYLTSEQTPLGYLHKLLKTESTSAFQFKKIHTIELPINIYRSVKNWDIWTGVSLQYTLAPTYTNVKNATTSPLEVINNDEVYQPMTEKFRSDPANDFKSRVGIGFNLGAAYYLTDKWSIYTNLSQNIWDNTTTDFGKDYTKTFLKVPNVQLGLQFHINTSKKVKLLMDKNSR